MNHSKCLIVVISTQYPSYGGSGTNAYSIIKYLRSKQFVVVGIFLEDNTGAITDPDNIGNIHHIPCYPFVYNIRSSISMYKSMFNNLLPRQPDLVLCKNYIAPMCSKQLFPLSKTVYLVSGLSNMIDICGRIDINKLAKSNATIEANLNDTIAVERCDLVVANSPLSLNLLRKSFPNSINKIYPKPVDTSKYIDFDTLKKMNMSPRRIYDFIIVSSILTRKEKNNMFLISILSKPDYDGYTKLIIGNDNAEFQSIPNSTVHNLIPQKQLFELMTKSKVLLYPSLYDSSPSTIREAIECGCLVLTSNKIGYHDRLPKEYVCSTFEQTEWIKKSLHLVKTYDKLVQRGSNRQKTSSQSDLIDLVYFSL